MRPADQLPELFLCREPVDFRKGILGLSVLVESELEQDPFSERLFVFINRARTGIKILYWERNGFCLWQKKLEQERFKWPRHLSGSEIITLDGQDPVGNYVYCPPGVCAVSACGQVDRRSALW